MFLYVILIIIFFIPFSLLLPTRVKGKKNFKKLKKEGYILIANHQSFFDVPLIAIKFSRHLHFVAKSELSKNKFMNWLVKNAGCYFVERGKPNLAFFKESQKILKNGKVLCMFPEGTRKKISEDEMGQLKNGVAMLSIKTGVKILPIYIKKKPSLFKFNTIIVGEPFDLNEFDKVTHESLAKATEKIANKFNDLQEICNKKHKK